MTKLIQYLTLLLLALLSTSCGSDTKRTTLDLENTDWETLVDSTSGQTVNFMMWQGSPVINEYINNCVVPTVKLIEAGDCTGAQEHYKVHIHKVVNTPWRLGTVPVIFIRHL